MSLYDTGIDLGTVNTVITVAGKGTVVNEPSVIAYDQKKKQIIAVGEAAYDMIGRSPDNVITTSPLKDGTVSDIIMAEAMISWFMRKVGGSKLLKPRIIICVPSFVTDAERGAVVDIALYAGAGRVYVIDEAVAALLGAGVDISEPNGNMVVDIGGGSTDIAVISFSGIVNSESVKVAGNKFDEAIIRYVSQKYNLLIGEKTAENIKKNIVDVYDPSGEKTMQIKGRHLVNGLPSTIEISGLDIAEAIKAPVMKIVDEIKAILELTPPELVGDIQENGIILTGGSALLGGLSKMITRETGVKCYVATDPLECVARGISKAFKLSGKLLDGFEKISLYK